MDSVTRVQLKVSTLNFVMLKNKILLGEIKTLFLISLSRKWAYWFGGDLAPKITLTCLAYSAGLLCMCVICVAFIATVRMSVCTGINTDLIYVFFVLDALPHMRATSQTKGFCDLNFKVSGSKG